ncbi:ectoine/hydroxyectoine ABC transporter permease subunit EhuD [Streptomyces albidoflavus]|jgi:polar amino acid transport system permease protein|uniref:Ectoine/hydroxyectoine ABC transporter permease subunit EhuD n=2 Tax=Streptomyces TaxID=1883 RepID=A0ACC7XZR7_9ACTN|nr:MULTISPECIES: ectoine/hydroxyectoine ABC transporter permease subunit EhuD [Streptomyces]MYX84258.1 ectoine/hydroxyectoine ABC transporter permease subunit EhuD [Streptomyces sp. SID4915]QLA56754.1 ectoine/hydroxyectoine ABC transporter permease subunit EhuD [Streptomyces violascens]SCD77418.1 amino acid ABC transporter membrane protein 2, PAAT family [Streptomyces sp. IgraMP-1]MBF4134266.1 ectoine/hydroxyectoine ABC transporter permease subunit EhuD [Streptomyces albidoflavus]MBT2877399.1 
MNWDWSAVTDFMPRFWDGVLVTLQATVIGSLISFTLGLVWAIAFRAPTRFVRWPVTIVTEFIRNTPLLVQLFFLFFVLPEWGIQFSALTTGIIAIGLHYSTYTAQVYRAGIDAVPVGQWEAATALSLPARRTWTAVILPQAIRRVVPALGNYVVSMLKDTPLLAGIGVLEMLQQSRLEGAATFQYTEPLTVVGIAFILIAYPASLLLRALERRLVR